MPHPELTFSEEVTFQQRSEDDAMLVEVVETLERSATASLIEKPEIQAEPVLSERYTQDKATERPELISETVERLSQVSILEVEEPSSPESVKSVERSTGRQPRLRDGETSYPVLDDDVCIILSSGECK